MIHDAGEADSKKPFLFRIPSPDRTEVAEVGKGGLEGSEDSR